MTTSQSELQSLRDAFELLDSEGTGEIRVHELQQTLVELQLLNNDNKRGRYIYGLLMSIQKLDSDATLSLDNFLSLLTSPNPDCVSDDVENVFQLFDVDGQGYINMEKLRTVAKDLGEMKDNDAALHEMIQRISSSGRVTLDQFRDIMNSNC